LDVGGVKVAIKEVFLSGFAAVADVEENEGDDEGESGYTC
jgi:hypothetical protein